MAMTGAERQRAYREKMIKGTRIDVQISSSTRSDIDRLAKEHDLSVGELIEVMTRVCWGLDSDMKKDPDTYNELRDVLKKHLALKAPPAPKK